MTSAADLSGAVWRRSRRSTGDHDYVEVADNLPGIVALRDSRHPDGPALVFNLHEQFEALRASGKYARLRDVIRERDAALQGTINPMVSDHGNSSEARQYSGRAVESDWVAPFEPTP